MIGIAGFLRPGNLAWWALLAVGMSLGVAACTGDGEKSSCGPAPYVATVNGTGVGEFASCAGNLPNDPTPITVHVNATIQVQTSGEFSYGYPAPTTLEPTVVAASGQTTSVATFTARGAGQTELTVTSQYCPTPTAAAGSAASCAIFRITVDR